MSVNDAQAFNMWGCFHKSGLFGVPRDQKKALELWKKAATLGSALALGNIADAIENGRGVNRDNKKVKYYYEQESILGGMSTVSYIILCCYYVALFTMI